MHKHKQTLFYIFLCSLLMISACVKKRQLETPISVMEEYINIAMTAKASSDRSKLLELTTGNAYQELKGMSDKEFDEKFIQSKFRFIAFKAKDLREENDGSLSLVYELSYEAKAEGNPATVTNKKIAYLGKDDSGHWKIKDTKNIKSLIESKNGLEVMK